MDFFKKIKFLFFKKKKYTIQYNHYLHIRLFFRFLKYHKIYRLFIKELSKTSAKRWREKNNILNRRQNDFILYQTHFNPNNLLVNAFLWSNTKHGRVFWEHINKEWLKALEKTKNILGK